MLYDNILIPYDGSQSAHAALIEAVRFAKEDPGLTLHIIQIVDMEKPVIDKLEGKGGTDASVPESMRQAVEEALCETEARLRRKIKNTVHGLMNRIVIDILKETHIGSQIVSYAFENNCDLIVMGSRGLGALRGILGSVSNYVLREASVPVMVVKD